MEGVACEPGALGQVELGQGREGGAESTQACRQREWCEQRHGSQSVCVGKWQVTLFGWKGSDA